MTRVCIAIAEGLYKVVLAKHIAICGFFVQYAYKVCIRYTHEHGT